MWSLFLLLLQVALAAIPLTVVVPANDRACYFVRAHRADAHIRAAFTVMQGGSFDIDATLTRPDGTVLERVTKSGSEEFTFAAGQVGEFELCFYNEMSTVSEKKIEFEFEVDTNAVQARLPPTYGDGQTEDIEKYLNELDFRSGEISRALLHYKMRNARNESTVRSTGSRVKWFSMIELAAIVSMAVLNVTIVQFFFKGSRKNLV